jgi:hypothetical protein
MPSTVPANSCRQMSATLPWFRFKVCDYEPTEKEKLLPGMIISVNTQNYLLIMQFHNKSVLLFGGLREPGIWVSGIAGSLCA